MIPQGEHVGIVGKNFLHTRWMPFLAFNIQAANSVDILKAKHIVHHTTLSLQKQKCSHKDNKIT